MEREGSWPCDQLLMANGKRRVPENPRLGLVWLRAKLVYMVCRLALDNHVPG
jgi:hypothetical protein